MRCPNGRYCGSLEKWLDTWLRHENMIQGWSILRCRKIRKEKKEEGKEQKGTQRGQRRQEGERKTLHPAYVTAWIQGQLSKTKDYHHNAAAVFGI